jgi:hypothetical protein
MKPRFPRLLWCGVVVAGLGLLPAAAPAAVPWHPPLEGLSCFVGGLVSDDVDDEEPAATGYAPVPEEAEVPGPEVNPSRAELADAFGGGAIMESAATPMFGRADRLNRFNLFDNMAAIPSNRVWAGYDYAGHFDPNRAAADAAGAAVPGTGGRRTLALYRAGVEVGLDARWSVIAQEQYVVNTGRDLGNDAWARPLFVVKFAAIQTDCTVISALFGVQPEIGSGVTAQERATTYYPGALFYHRCGCAFVQGGFQVAFSDRAYNDPDTFDYGLSLGYWLYRAAACGEQHCIVTGVVPQVEVFGSEVLTNGNRVRPDTIDGVTFIGTTQARHVIDVTGGVRFLFGDCMSLGAAVSFPATGPDIRNAEFVSALNLYF